MVFGQLQSIFNSDSPPSQKAVDDFCRHAMEGNTGAVRKFLDKHKETVDVKDKDGWTALIYAAANGHIECVSLLLERGADVNLTTTGQGVTALWAAARNFTGIVELLLTHGADPNKKDDTAVTPLMQAAQFGSVNIVSALLKAGAMINEINEYGDTALKGAVRYNRRNIIKLLLGKGADLNQGDDFGMTVLMEVIKQGDYDTCYDIVKMLLEAGADVNQKDKHGQTALDQAGAIDAYKINHYDEMIALLKKWPKIQAQRQLAAKEAQRQQWLEATDFSDGLDHSIRAPKVLKIPGKKGLTI
jgi:ankyrin repeat protein